MIRVRVEVYSGALRRTLSIQAENLLAAVGVARRSYPGGDVRVVFPIDPEGFFVRETGTPEAAELQAHTLASREPVGVGQKGRERE